MLKSLDSDALVTATGGLAIPPSTGPTFPDPRPPTIPFPQVPSPAPHFPSPTFPRPMPLPWPQHPHVPVTDVARAK